MDPCVGGRQDGGARPLELGDDGYEYEGCVGGGRRRHDNCSTIVCPHGFPFRPYLGPELLYTYYFHKANFHATVTTNTILARYQPRRCTSPPYNHSDYGDDHDDDDNDDECHYTFYNHIYLLYISPTTALVVFTMTFRTMFCSRSFSLSLYICINIHIIYIYSTTFVYR